ncbi:unnamed protein product, partial [Rotaria sp. Silwood2]
CMTNYGLGNLVFFDDRLDSSRYITILDTNLKSAYKYFPKQFINKAIFQQANARQHVSKKTRNYLNKHHITTLQWPANSPDLNLIENLWSIMDKQLMKYPVKTIDDLKTALASIWKSISINVIQNLYKSMRNRLQQVIKRKGLPCHS